MYVIQQKFDTSLFWNTETGYGPCQDATVFEQIDLMGVLNIPVDGVWVSYNELRREIDRLHEAYDELNTDLRVAAQSLSKIRKVLEAYQ